MVAPSDVPHPPNHIGNAIQPTVVNDAENPADTATFVIALRIQPVVALRVLLSVPAASSAAVTALSASNSLHGFHSSHEAGVRAGSRPSAKYAAIHQFGGNAGRGHKSKIPARPFLPMILMGKEARLSDSTLDSVLELTRYYVNGKLI